MKLIFFKPNENSFIEFVKISFRSSLKISDNFSDWEEMCNAVKIEQKSMIPPKIGIEIVYVVPPKCKTKRELKKAPKHIIMNDIKLEKTDKNLHFLN